MLIAYQEIDYPTDKTAFYRQLREQVKVAKDVHCFVGHIACDCSSVSELVVPVLGQDQEVVGLIDIDSPVPGRFDEADAAGLMAIAGIVAPFFENLNSRHSQMNNSR